VLTSDGKTPVQKWQSVDIDRVSTEKSKHVHITIGGSTPSTLHFQASSKDNADAIAEKLESSKALSTPTQPQKDDNVRLPPIRVDVVDPEKTRSVRFSESSPVIIPARDTSEDGDEGDIEGESPGMDHSNDLVESAAGEAATALYDFEADGEDELSVKEGERLLVLEKDGDEWWKCQNTNGVEGVVPASYIEVGGSF
jgi:actin cytoskeleton-regulatory complex protein SLA1